MKKYIYIIIGLLVLNLLIIGGKFTYSSFASVARGQTNYLSLARINFNNERSRELSFSLGNLKPGEIKNYKFKVSNYNNGSGSDVNIGYRLTIQTYHFIPTTIELYKRDKNVDIDELVLVCDELSERNEENKINCVSDTYTLDYNYQDEDEYLLKIIYNEKSSNQDAWSSEYSEILDFLDIKIDSWQLTEEKENE